MRSLRVIPLTGLAAILAFTAACTSSGSATTAEPGKVAGSGAAVTDAQTYKLGLGIPLTGSAASYGAEYRAIVQMGIDAANKKYGADGITIKLVVEDTQATAEGGVSAMNKLGALEKTPAVLTAWSAVVKAALPVAKDLDFALFNAGAQSPALVGSNPNLVNVLPMNDTELAGFTKYLTEDLKLKTFATIYVDNETGQGTASAFVTDIEKRGGKVVAQESIRQDATDASTQVAKVMAAKPDFVYIQTLLVEGAATMKSAREMQLTAKMGSYAGVGESRVIRDAGQTEMNGFYYMSHIPKNLDATKALLADLQAANPKMVIANQSYDPYFYMTPFLYAEVIKRLRATGAPVTGANVLALLNKDADIEVPIIGKMDLTDQLTYKAATVIRQIQDYKAGPLEDKTVAAVTGQ